MANVGESSRYAHVADDPEHHLLRRLLCDEEPEHCELSGFGLSWRLQDADDKCCAYVCVTVAEARVKVNGTDYVITFDDAHISVANISLRPDISKKKLNSQDKVTSLFEKTERSPNLSWLPTERTSRVERNALKRRKLSQLAERRHRPYHEQRSVAVQHLRCDDAKSTLSKIALWPHPAPVSEARLSGDA